MRNVALFLCMMFVSCSRAGVVYVSSTEGDDINDGRTEQKPLKTIAKALEKGDTVLLKSGNVFYSKGLKARGKYLSRYGNEVNPIVCGYKRIVRPKWEKAGANVWKLNLAENNFKGVILNGSSLSNNIGCLHEYDKDLMHGHKVQYLSELKEDWDIWQSERFDKDTPANEFDWVYLYYSGNPNNLKLEFSITDIALHMWNSTVEGIDFKGYGFGIFVESSSNISNCKIDAIGGRTQIGYEAYTCYGNGIEIWSGVQECVVENCIVSRCYDSGCTIQGHSGKPQSIVFRKNVVIDCCQGWEDFLRNENLEMNLEKCVFENNIVVNSGLTSGFSYPQSRFKYCHVLDNNHGGNRGARICNNRFVGGNYYCSGAYKGEYKTKTWEGNTCVIKRGDFILSNYTGSKDVIRIPTQKGKHKSLRVATVDAIRRYRELTGDLTTRFVIKDEKAIEKQIVKLKRKYLVGRK